MMQGTFEQTHTLGNVLCCLCGIGIPPNPSNMCVNCIRSQVDITEGIQKQCTLIYCKECGRYLQPPKHWTRADLESKELLTLCIKKIKGLQKVKLVDAGFIWTEPHSRRVKMKLTIQREVFNGAILQQSFVVEFVVETNMCADCNRANTNIDVWRASVQVRQHVEHKRTFLMLEQLILKHGADVNCLQIRAKHEGLDFFYSNRSHGLKFIDFLQTVVPLRFRMGDKQLVSHDTHDNTYNYKFTFSVEIVPICRDDLLCLPQKVYTALGGLGPLVLCTRVTNQLTLTDPLTLQTATQDAKQFFALPYRPVLTPKAMVEFIVLDVEPMTGGAAPGSGGSKFQLADVEVARRSDFGRNDITFHTRTILGAVLKPGDVALGYDMTTAQVADPEMDRFLERGYQPPEIVLVRKSYKEKRSNRRNKGYQRAWTLKHLDMEMEDEPSGVRQRRDQVEREAADKERFMEEIEEDPELRARIAIFRDPAAAAAAAQGAAGVSGRDAGAAEGSESDDDVPDVPLDELLDLLTLDDRRRAARAAFDSVQGAQGGGEEEEGDAEDEAMEDD